MAKPNDSEWWRMMWLFNALVSYNEDNPPINLSTISIEEMLMHPCPRVRRLTAENVELLREHGILFHRF